MNSFRLNIAGIHAEIICPAPKVVSILKHRYSAFLVEEKTSVQAHTISINLENGIFAKTEEKEPSFDETCISFGYPGFIGNVNPAVDISKLTIATKTPIEDIDYFLRVVYAALAFRAGGFMFHAAGIARGGKGYLFFGHSGSGKSTVARLTDGGLVLNDDLLVLLPDKNHWRAYGTPFSNPTQVHPSPGDVTVTALFRLVQNTQVYLEKMDAGLALGEMVTNIPVLSAHPSLCAELLARCSNVLSSIPAYRLNFLPDSSFWSVVETCLPCS